MARGHGWFWIEIADDTSDQDCRYLSEASMALLAPPDPLSNHVLRDLLRGMSRR